MAGLITDWQTIAAQHLNETDCPDWLRRKKQQALEQLSLLRAPHRKLEYWRYSDTSRLVLKEDVQALPSDLVLHPSLENEAVKRVVIKFDDDGFVVSGDGQKFLSVQPIAESNESEWLDVTFTQETVANLLNTACFNQGVSVTFSDQLTQPVLLVFDYAFTTDSKWRFVRNHIQVKAGCEVKIQEQWTSGNTNVVNVFHVNKAATVERCQNVCLNSNQGLISFNQFQMADESSVNCTNQHLGGFLQHHIHRVNFDGEGACYKMGTVNKTIKNNNIADLVEVNHHKKGNRSEVTHRSIADDASQIFTNAKAYVAVGADESDIEQDLKNILLSPEAKIFSKPELEVYADEVVAAHGSTIGALDEKALFYLQSRGISIEQARAIMIESFEQEALVC